MLAARGPRKKGASPLSEVLADLRSGECERASVRLLAKRWTWSVGRVFKYLQMLRENRWVERTGKGYRWTGENADNADFWLTCAVERDDLMFGRERNRRIPAKVRREVFAKGGGRCAACGSTDNLHIDHIRPYSRRGRHHLSNLRLLCRTCNLKKGDKLDRHWSGAPGRRV